MATTLKSQYGLDVARWLAARVRAVLPAFDVARFERTVARGYAALSLTDRGRRMADVLAELLPADVPEALAVLARSWGPPIAGDELVGLGLSLFDYLPDVYFVATYATAHVDEALAFQHGLTQRFSAEFSLRAFLDRWPEETFAALSRWVKDPSPHVRRLVSEGTRPRLPWAPRVVSLDAHPERALALLDELKDDSSSMVRRSVANHLNDVAKFEPKLVLATCRRWLSPASKPSEARRELVAHALRTLVKKGDAEALRLLGFGAQAALTVDGLVVRPRRVVEGDAVLVEGRVHNPGKTAARAVVAVRVHYVKANGRTSPKTFKVKEVTLPPGAAYALSYRVQTRRMTTRRHHAGRHAVEVVVNGAATPAGDFVLTLGRAVGQR